MVGVREVLAELTLPKLKKVADRMGIQVHHGVTGFLSKQVLGVELRQAYINSLSNSRLVTLEEIDRILGTRFSRIEREEPPERSSRGRTAQFAADDSSAGAGGRPWDDSVAAPTAMGTGSASGLREHILGRYLYREDLQDLCAELELPVGGNKYDLATRIAQDPRFSLGMALAYVDKPTLKMLCEEFGIKATGTRDELERRVVGYASRREPREMIPSPPLYAPVSNPVQSYQIPPSMASQAPQPPPRREFFATQSVIAPPPLEFPEAPSPTLIPETHAPQVAQLQMVTEFLDNYRPSQRFRNEQAYEIELAALLRQQFGPENVKTQVSIYGGRIDIEVLGIGLEIKVPGSRAQLQTLLGQLAVYRNYYGPNLIALVFNDFAKVQDVNEFSNILRGRGIVVLAK